MVLANEHIKFKGKDDTYQTISETVEDMHAYQQLNDSVSDCESVVCFFFCGKKPYDRICELS